MNEKIINPRKKILLTVGIIVVCIALIACGIFFAKWYKGNVATLNAKEFLTTQDVVKLLKKNGIELTPDASVNVEAYKIKALDSSGSEVEATPSVYIGFGKGDEIYKEYTATGRTPEEHDVRVFIYELEQYVGGVLDQYPQYIENFRNESSVMFNTMGNPIKGKNILMVFTNTAEYTGSETVDSEQEQAMLIEYQDGYLALGDLISRTFDVLFEKAFNGETVYFNGESENWEVMMPVRCFHNESTQDLLGYDSSGFAEGWILFKKKNGNIEDSLVYRYEMDGSSISSTTGIKFKSSDEYEGWYILDSSYRTLDAYDRLYAKSTNYSVTITDESAVPETIVAVREGFAYTPDTAAVEAKAKMRETDLYKAVVPAMEEAIRSEYEPYVNIEKIVVADWDVDDISDDSAELTLNVMYSLYNKDLTRVDYLEELKVDSSEEIYQHYSEDYLSSKMVTLYYEVEVKTAEKVLANEYVISNTYKDGVICIEDVSPLTDQGDPVFDIYRFLDIYEKSDLVFEPGSKRVLHTSEVSVAD